MLYMFRHFTRQILFLSIVFVSSLPTCLTACERFFIGFDTNVFNMRVLLLLQILFGLFSTQLQPLFCNTCGLRISTHSTSLQVTGSEVFVVTVTSILLYLSVH